jgi:hypothetical protein
MPDIDLATLEKLNLALSIMGFSVVGTVLTWLNNRIQTAAPIVGETLEFIDGGIDAVTAARAVVMEAFEDGKIDESELKAAAAILRKAVKDKE